MAEAPKRRTPAPRASATTSRTTAARAKPAAAESPLPLLRPKLLFVLSADFGNLSDALYFVKGEPFDTVLLMPERLRAVSGNVPVPALTYTSPDDVLEAVARERPDIVFLLSGYLYTVNGIFDITAVQRIVMSLRRTGVPTVTSDPFCGLLARLDDATFSDAHPRKPWLMEHFGQLHALFKDIPHLYLAEPRDDPGAPAVWFFNEHVLVSPSALDEARQLLASAFRMDPDRRRWLFILSTEDYGFQLAERPSFNDLLHARLDEVARAGRQPVLVAPELCVTAMQTRRSITGLVLLPFCEHGSFTALLQDAEYAFYWNVFSNSIPMRGANGLPLFFFDRGHMARAVPPVLEAGMRWYYPGTELTYLDLTQPLAGDELARLAAGQQQSMAGARDNFRRAPSPETMVRTLLARR